MENLYRIISFPAFINLVEQKKERYVSPATWEDTHEGYLLRLLEHERYRKDVLKKLYADFSGNDISELICDYMRLWATRWLCFAQCWSKLEESDALWRIYSYDNMSVRIRTKQENIHKLVSKSKTINEYDIYFKDVIYDLNSESDLDKQFELFTNTAEPTEPFFHKRKAFEHEHEKRVILTPKNYIRIFSNLSGRVIRCNFISDLQERNYFPNNLTEELLDILVEHVSKNQINFDKVDYFKKSMMIDIPDLTSYIDGVMVHPQAEDWIVSLVESICKRTGLNFEGKSKMYSALS